MEQSPSWEAYGHLTSQEIPLPLWNLNFHYHVYKSVPLRPNPEPDESNPRLNTLFPQNSL